MNQILNRTNRLSPEIKIPPEETTYSHPYEKKITDNTGTLYNTVANMNMQVNWCISSKIQWYKLICNKHNRI